jgi:mono/diheme cytochrome c family protein
VSYPIWEVPSGGLLIAFISIVHVIVSHFAVGGGLFLVLTEIKARREGDDRLLDYVRRHSRFFLLLTLVFGAMTGVGIWFTIALVHPQATSSLINTYVWGWAMEWTFFVAEIAAAMVYYYGWDRLSAKVHVTVGWIYFVAAWASLAIINGILSFMMTPGEWVTDRSFWSGFFNPTYASSTVMRTFVCIGLAGVYALLTSAWSRDSALKEKIARYAGLYWVIPMGIAVPLSLIWYLSAAASAGVPVAEILGASSGSMAAIIASLFTGVADSGYPAAQRAALYSIVASALVLAITLIIVTVRRRSYGMVSTLTLLGLALVAMGGGEWIREDLRKPYVIGQHMFVNGVRLPPPAEVAGRQQVEDPLAIDALNERGVLRTALFTDVPEEYWSLDGIDDPARRAELLVRAGEEMFRMSCTACHTVDGALAVRPLVSGMSVRAVDRMLSKLALPVDASGEPTEWSDPSLRLETWRGRRMPPFAGTDEERRALAVYLARIGGMEDAGLEPLGGAAPVDAGRQLYDDQCAFCHEPGGDWPIQRVVAGRDADGLYGALGRLSELNEMMPDFEGTDEERRALAEFLAGLGTAGGKE